MLDERQTVGIFGLHARQACRRIQQTLQFQTRRHFPIVGRHAARDGLELLAAGKWMLDHEKGTYYGLDAVGNRVWQMLAEGKAPAELPGALAAEFDAPLERIEQDVALLLEDLLAQGLLVRD